MTKGLGECRERDSELFEILRQVVNSCETYSLYKKTPPKPAVGLPLATDFNQTLAVDLHELETNAWYLHIIDEFTRFSAGAIVRESYQMSLSKSLSQMDKYIWVSKVVV